MALKDAGAAVEGVGCGLYSHPDRGVLHAPGERTTGRRFEYAPGSSGGHCATGER